MVYQSDTAKKDKELSKVVSDNERTLELAVRELGKDITNLKKIVRALQKAQQKEPKDTNKMWGDK